MFRLATSAKTNQVFFVAIASSSNLANQTADESDVSRDQSLSKSLQERLFRATAEGPGSDIAKNVNVVCFKPEDSTNVSIIATIFNLNSLFLVSDSVGAHGTPPAEVVQDWNEQIQEFNLTKAEEIDSNFTLATADGTLVPLGPIWKRWCKEHGFSEYELEVNQLQDAGVSISPYQCVWSKTVGQTKASQSSVTSVTSVAPKATAPFVFAASKPSVVSKRSKNTSKMAIGALVVGGVVLGIAAWLGMSGGTREKDSLASKNPLPQSTKDSLSTIRESDKATSNALSKAEDASTDESEPINLQTIDLKTSLEGLDDTKELTLDSLLATIQMKPLDSIVSKTETKDAEARVGLTGVPQNDSTVMVQPDPDSSPMSMAMRAIASDQPVPKTSDELDAKAMDTLELKPMVTEDGQLRLTETIKPDSSLKKFSISIGRPIVSKACVCEVELKLDGKNLVVEPSEKVAIEDEEKASWRIAIEDEEPELHLVVFSKPGTKWQVITALGLRMSASSVPILLGPKDAQSVLVRLGAQKQMLRNHITVLEAARSMPKKRTRIDFYAEIKNRERAERELEQAIEQWKTIAKLSSNFYSLCELQLQLSAEVKDK